MVTVDLDTRVEEVEEAVCPHITSKFLCAPGCPTGGIACFSARPAALHASLPSVLTAAASLWAASG